MKYQQLAVGLLVGLVVGVSVMHILNPPERYSIQIMNEVMALKLDKRTGQTWKLRGNGTEWIPISSTNSPDIFDRIHPSN